jgi:3-oxoacyl-[acyl-carrier protein] reductase
VRLRDKVAIVTGSTRGIGEAIATRFAAEGARVVVCGRSERRGPLVVDAIREAGGAAVFARADLSDETQAESVIRQTVEEFGAVTTLVNNAGPMDLSYPGGSDRPVTELDADVLTKIVASGLLSMMFCCKFAIPEMIRAGGGAIVNVSSVTSERGLAGLAGYAAAKGGMNAITRQVAVQYGPDVRSNALLVGQVDNGSKVAASLRDDPVVSAAIREFTLTRPGDRTDVANAALFLASDEAGFITGALLPVDGGAMCKFPMPDMSGPIGASVTPPG